MADVQISASKILVIDDDLKLSNMLGEYLAPEGIELTAAATGNEGLAEARANDYELIILDVMLPGLSGFDVLRQFRKTGGRTPVIMLTARGDDVDRIVGLEMGADDYLPKPFNPRELLARIKAILRRTAEPPEDAPESVECGPLHANVRRREVRINGDSLNLTNAEFVILVTLMRSQGGVVSREALTRAALGRQLLPDDRSLDTHISNLRRKLKKDPQLKNAIRSIRGSGYIIVPPDG
jgi:DNA-binding response OmpR family regulator